MNMILRKRHIILASLVLALGVAVYLNYQFTAVGNDFVQTSTSQEGKNYGDAQFVDKNVSSDEMAQTSGEAEAEQTEGEISADSGDPQAYFTMARMNRQKSRDEAVETISTMITAEGLGEEEKDALTMQATQIAQAVETETKIENMVKAKGFEDCMVYLDEDKANISVQTQGLLAEEAAQIKDIILRETNVAVENISIVEVK